MTVCSSPAQAQAPAEQYTLFINQVRGDHCCDPGSATHFENQLRLFRELGLPATFNLRYDTLIDPEYHRLFQEYPEFEYGVLLEVIPELARAAQVAYQGSEKTWFEAQHALLIGYSDAERELLIDTIIDAYQSVFDRPPEVSGAWMIDPHSLAYLHQTHQIKAHQITREQFGTDSYTLYGGPMHYPYYPSDHWALIPDSTTTELPLIIRQTIMDPVRNYGDRSNSYTSQPNDYFIRDESTAYFEYLFAQAHAQPNDHTIAVLGLENSMPAEIQAEFARQLKVVKEWERTQPGASVLTASEYSQRPTAAQPIVYQGRGYADNSEQAWWIQTDRYRARVRKSGESLYLSDLRVYDPAFSDPYASNQAEASGWWIVPFLIDASRITSPDQDLIVYPDGLHTRAPALGDPQRVEIAASGAVQLIRTPDSIQLVDDSDEPVITFTLDTISFTKTPYLAGARAEYISSGLQWGQAWGIQDTTELTWTFFTSAEALEEERLTHRGVLFPEASFGTPSWSTSEIVLNNAYAVADRNPIRIVIFPKNDAGDAIMLQSLPVLSHTGTDIDQTTYEPHSSNGMVFYDLDSERAQSVSITLSNSPQDSMSIWSGSVYFAPNCKETPVICIRSPRKSWWYLRAQLGDWQRARQERIEQASRDSV